MVSTREIPEQHTTPRGSYPMTEAGTRLLLLMMLGASVAGCTASRGQVFEDQPTLVVPPVPPRAIDPPQTAELPAVEPMPDTPIPPPPTTTKPSGRSSNRTEPKPEPKPETPPETTSSPPNPPPVPALRTPATPSGPDATRQIRESLDRATGMLNKVDYQKLTSDGRANYNTAKGLIDQGNEALNKGDLASAVTFANRAESIAKLLASR
jgi:outer membrane biosynthesis protein TonB